MRQKGIPLFTKKKKEFNMIFTFGNNIYLAYFHMPLSLIIPAMPLWTISLKCF